MGLSTLLRRLGGECKFAGECKKNGLYNPQNETCAQTRGAYYADGAPAGCYVKLQNFKEALDESFK